LGGSQCLRVRSLAAVTHGQVKRERRLQWNAHRCRARSPVQSRFNWDWSAGRKTARESHPGEQDMLTLVDVAADPVGGQQHGRWMFQWSELHP